MLKFEWEAKIGGRSEQVSGAWCAGRAWGAQQEERPTSEECVWRVNSYSVLRTLRKVGCKGMLALASSTNFFMRWYAASCLL